MRSVYAAKILSEETLHVKETRAKTIERLREMSGRCHQSSMDGEQMRVVCTKKGDIFADSYQIARVNFRTYRQYSTCCVRGNVLTENQRTVVKLYGVLSRHRLFYRICGTILIVIACLLTITALWLSGMLTDDVSLEGNLILVAMILWVFVILERMCLKSTKELHTDHLDLLKEEVRKRVEAVGCWDK